MKVSIQWLKEYVDFSMSPEELADVLTMAGQEVEGIEKFEDDSILDISITPNRPDCLSVRGIAREISAILEIPFKDKFTLIREEEGVRPLIEIQDSELCSRYSSRIIRGVKVGNSPEWIVKRLEQVGLRPVNNIVDITNYVLLEMGHPLHAFDLDRLHGKCIVVKTPGKTREFKTLDNETRTLSKDMLMIWDGKKPVAIAGVMGGLDSEVTESTFDVLLESAYFDPRSVRRTSKALNLTTEASYRFERGADIKITVPALDRAAKLIMEIAGGMTTKLTDVYVKPFNAHQVLMSLRKMNNVLGVDIESTLVAEMLTRLGIENRKEGQGITVFSPSFRQDIQRDTDVIEEVARLYGYDRIPKTLPKVEMHPATENQVWNLLHTIKESMRKSGYSEAINFSFLNPSVLDTLRLSPDDRRRDLMMIRNPLKKDEQALRTTLIPALLENAQLNIHRGVKTLRLFEIAKVFFSTDRNLPDEVLKLSAVYVKAEQTSVWQTKHDGFYDIKGALENLLSELGIKQYSFGHGNDTVEQYLHPGKSASVEVNEGSIGVFGALHPQISHELDITPETFVLEVDIDNLLALVPSKISYTPVPKYPYVERDLAIVIPESITASVVEGVIRGIDTSIIESVILFDIYTGKPIPKGQKSMAFSIRYRAEDRTLIADEVNQLHTKILEKLKETLQAELRS
jgi:phenylalanyl-tRNA synthetase beta chain